MNVIYKYRYTMAISPSPYTEKSQYSIVQAPCSDQSVFPSIWDHLSGAYFFSLCLHRVPLVKGCAVTLNKVFRSKVYTMAEICEKALSGSYIPFPQSNQACTSPTEYVPLIKGCAVTLSFRLNIISHWLNLAHKPQICLLVLIFYANLKIFKS